MRRACNWITAIFMVLFHVTSVAAFFFSLANLPSRSCSTGSRSGFGISLGYHRLLTHRGFKTSKPFEYFLALCGSFALEGGPIFWVATHRVHHQHSDKDGDPHTPREGGFWAHMGWVLFGDSLHNKTAVMSKYAPDLGGGSLLPLADDLALGADDACSASLLIAVVGWGMAAGGCAFASSLGLHFTWLVNSATHMWGRRRFETRDDSRNSWWVAMLTFGEGWHNNHHAHPVSAATACW